jgi:hypothetical protein
MVAINLCNSKGRDALVMAESVRAATRVRWLDEEGRQVNNCRILKGTVTTDIDTLLAGHGSLDKVAQALIKEDPEIDLEMVGSFLRDTSRVYVDSEKKIAHKVQVWEVVRAPDGTEKARRPSTSNLPNITPDQPLRWTGKLLPKREVFNKFVIASKLQIVHVNGLTYDFLFEMARELEQKNAVMIVGAGPKGNQPLILRRNATPYRGFLEGKTRGQEYCLILHLSNMELKAPEVKAPQEAVQS